MTEPVPTPAPSSKAALPSTRHAFAFAFACALGFVVTTSIAACRPVGLAGDECASGPCAAGLTCVKDVCTLVQPPPPPPPPCTQDADCVLNGSADGRTCNTTDGTCGFSTCVIDQQCGTRICDSGNCADNVPCIQTGDCAANQVCTNNACRSACQSDTDCPAIGGISLSTCVAGTCEQRCLGDFMCLGAICESNLCVPPQCAVDGDCTGPAHYFCNTGRCQEFTPCTTNADCFDPNFQCDVNGRCAERAACTVDADCGGGLCQALHCQDAVACAANSDCTDANSECVAGRCVVAPSCRASGDCDAGKVCDAGRCTDPPAPVTPSLTVVKTPLGACFSGSVGACTVPAFVGDVVTLYAQGFAADGSPVVSTIALTASATHDIDAAGVATVTCDSAGSETVTFDDVDVDIACAPNTGDPLAILVYEAETGHAVAGAHVLVDDVEAGVTSGGGAFNVPVFTAGTVGVKSNDGRGFAVIDAAPGRLWLPLSSSSSSPSGAAAQAAGFRAQVTSDADLAVGPVGLSLALPPVARAADARLENVVGPPFTGSITIQIIGAIPVNLPASAMLNATLPLSGAQVIKQDAFDTAPAGPASALCYEQREQQQFVLNLAFGADPTTTALDFVALAEGMDAKLAAAGVLVEKPLVVDAADVNGDGNTTELVPDFTSFDEITVAPSTPATERVGVTTSAPPQSMNARAFAVCGVELPNGFMPLGVAAFSGSTTGEQVKVLAAPASIAGAARACTVHGVSADPSTQSFVVVRDASFSASLDAGALLDPPAGAFVLADVPATGDHSVVVPAVTGADALAVSVFDGATTWTVIGPAGGSLAMPSYLTPVALLGTTAYRFGGSVSSALGTGALRSPDDVAAAVSTSP